MPTAVGPGAALPTGRGAGATVGGVDGPGVTKDTITIGYVNTVGVEKYNAAFGISSGDGGGSPLDMFRTVVRDVNDRGGIGGRQLKVVVHDVDANDTMTRSDRAQSTCAAFTQDHKVLFATSTLYFDYPTYYSCLQHAGAGVINATGLSDLYDAQFSQYPLVYDVQMLPTGRAMSAMVDALQRANYFTGWNTASGAPRPAPVKVGIVVPDQTNWLPAVNQVLIPRLATAGFHVDPKDVIVWHFPGSTADNGSAVAQIQAAVLKLKADNVTHRSP